MKMLGIIDQQETLAFCDAGECINEKDLRNLFFAARLGLCEAREKGRKNELF